jgi:N6-adenosine-specific RNA methylase IME4
LPILTAVAPAPVEPLTLPVGPFDVVLADPPWKFRTRSAKGRGRCPDGAVGRFHYDTMDIDAIEALPVGAIAAKSAVLFLWATAPMMPQALGVLAAWGFTYRSQLVWVKDRIGTGYWARNRHELVLIGARGQFPTPASAVKPGSVIEGQQREHSRKPDRLFEIVERAWPDAQRIELFARGAARPGWTAWGAEADPGA